MSSSRTPMGCTADNGPGELPQPLGLICRSLDGTAVQVLHDSAIGGDGVQFADPAYAISDIVGMPTGRPSLTGSPEGDRVLVARSTESMGGGMLDRA